MNVETSWVETDTGIRASAGLRAVGGMPLEMLRRLRYMGTVLAASVIAIAITLPIIFLPSPHDNVFSALTYLISLGWFIGLNFVRTPSLALVFILMGALGVTGALVSQSAPAWLWLVWSLNVGAGIVGLAMGGHSRLTREVVTAWVAFHLTMMLTIVYLTGV